MRTAPIMRPHKPPFINSFSRGLNAFIPGFPYGFACGVFHRPAALKAIAENGAAHIKTAGAFRNRHGLAAPGDEDILPVVAVLSLPGGPAAIIRRIALFVVNPVKSISFAGMFTHVFKKVGKGQPPVADSDSTSAVMAIRSHFRIQAPALHIGPCPIGLALFHRNICNALPR